MLDALICECDSSMVTTSRLLLEVLFWFCFVLW